MPRRRLSAAHKAAISRTLRRKLGPTPGLDPYVPKGKSGRAKPKAVEPKPEPKKAPAKKAPAKAAAPVPAKKTPAKKTASKKAVARKLAAKNPAKKVTPPASRPASDFVWEDEAPARGPEKRDFKAAQEFVQDLIDDLKHESTGKDSAEARLLRAVRDVHEVDYMPVANAFWDGVSVDAVLDELDRHGGEPENTSELVALFSGGSLPERSVSVSDVLDAIGGNVPRPLRHAEITDDIGAGKALAEMTLEEAVNHQRAVPREATPKVPQLKRPVAERSAEGMHAFNRASKEAGLWGMFPDEQIEHQAKLDAMIEDVDSAESQVLFAKLDELREALAEPGRFDEPMIAFPYGVLDDILEAGGFRNGVELGEGRINGHVEARKLFEDQMMGADAPGTQRPIFGTFRRGPNDDQANLFGEFRAILYPDKGQEATFTLGDSYESFSTPQRVVDAANLDDTQLLSVVEGYRLENLANPWRERREGEGRDMVNYASYIEAQFHNGVSLSDISHVEVTEQTLESFTPHYQAGVKAAIAKMEAAGIRVVVNKTYRLWDREELDEEYDDEDDD